MRTNNNEITIFRGEEFTIHKEIVNRDGTPYIISSEYKNPCWLLSVSNSLHTQAGRMIRNYWLPIVTKKFVLNNVFHLKDLKNEAFGEPVYSSFSDVTEFPLRGYWNGKFVEIPVDYAVFECDGEYRYYDVNGQSHIYHCDLIKTFPTSDTKNWTAQDYVYSIQIACGDTTLEHLQQLCRINKLSDEGDVNALYDRLKEAGQVFDSDFDVGRYLHSVEARFPILAPTKLKVIEYAQGGTL